MSGNNFKKDNKNLTPAKSKIQKLQDVDLNQPSMLDFCKILKILILTHFKLVLQRLSKSKML
jgi:hypothetical protein